VYVDASGDFTMTGGTISGNTASESGGGVYVANQDFGGGGPYKFTMSGESSINGNSGKRGGGVYMESGNFAMAGGSISGNTASESGGGVYVGTPGEGYSGSPDFTMTGGTISGNTATENGGGVSFISSDDSSPDFTMNGGTISGNTAGGDGVGVYFDGSSFSMKDRALITQDNDVWLFGGKTINVGDENFPLTAVPAARITPSAYLPNTKVLDGYHDGISYNYTKFTVTPEADNTEWEIDSDGRLQPKN
jgi:hypothetical protein